MDPTKNDRPEANRAANQEHSGGNFEATSSLPEGSVIRCHRELHAPVSVARQSGPVCHARLIADSRTDEGVSRR